MTEQSELIKTTFENLKSIYNDTGNLLMDAESYLEKAGYRCLHGNTLGTEQSKNMNNPSWWITPYASRYVSTMENPSEIKAFGVFFLDMEPNPIEPVVLMGCFNMNKNENDEVLPYGYWYLRYAWFSLVSERKLGEVLNFDGKWNFANGKIIATSLDDIKDQETLQKNLVEPLIALSC